MHSNTIYFSEDIWGELKYITIPTPNVYFVSGPQVEGYTVPQNYTGSAISKDMPYYFVKSSVAHKINEQGHDQLSCLSNQYFGIRQKEGGAPAQSPALHNIRIKRVGAAHPLKNTAAPQTASHQRQLTTIV